MSGFLVSGFLVSGFLVSGFLVSGFLVSGFLVSGFPVSGFPVWGLPVWGLPVSRRRMAGRQLLGRVALAETVAETLQAAGRAGMEQRSDQQLDAGRPHQQPAASGRTRRGIEARQGVRQIIVGQHHVEVGASTGRGRRGQGPTGRCRDPELFQCRAEPFGYAPAGGAVGEHPHRGGAEGGGRRRRVAPKV